MPIGIRYERADRRRYDHADPGDRHETLGTCVRPRRHGDAFVDLRNLLFDHFHRLDEDRQRKACDLWHAILVMAGAVTTTLERILSPIRLDPATLKSQGRYVEDVY